MAFEKVGLGGTFTLDIQQAQLALSMAAQSIDRLQKEVDQTNPALARMKANMDNTAQSTQRRTGQMSSGIGGVATGMGALASAAVPLAIGYGLKKSADAAIGYESAFSNLRAVTEGTAADFDALAKKSSELGLSTQFSKTQVVEGMTEMSKAGATIPQILGGISGVAAAAAAEQMDLAEANTIVGATLRGMGMDWKDAGLAADILAKGAMVSSASIRSLGESYVYGSATAKQLNYSLADTTAIFDALHDAGMTGSLAGTGFTSMMRGLLAPSRKSQKIMKLLGITVTDSAGKIKPMTQLIDELGAAFGRITNEQQKAAAETYVFGTEGIRAFSALQTKGSKNLQALMDQMNESTGSAEKMAAERLNNVKGQFLLLSSSLETLSIEMWSSMLGPMKDWVKGAVDGVNQVLGAYTLFSDKGTDDAATVQESTQKFGATATQIALGLRDAIVWVQETVQSVTTWIKEFFGSMAKGDEGMRSLTTTLVKIAIGIAAAIPILAGLTALFFMFSSVVWPILTGAVGLIRMVGGAMFALSGPIGWIIAAIGLIAAAFFAVKTEGMGLWDTMKYIFDAISQAVMGFVEGFSSTFDGIFLTVKFAAKAIFDVLKALFGWMVSDSENTGVTMKMIFGGIGAAIGEVFIFLGKVVHGFAVVVEGVIMKIREWIERTLQFFAKAFNYVSWLWKKQDEFEADRRRLDTVGGNINAQYRDWAIQRGAEEKRYEKELEAMRAGTETKVAPAKAAAAKPPALDVNLKLEDKRVIENKMDVNVDGEKISQVITRKQVEIQDRAGAKSTPWRRRQALEAGSSALLQPAGG